MLLELGCSWWTYWCALTLALRGLWFCTKKLWMDVIVAFFIRISELSKNNDPQEFDKEFSINASKKNTQKENGKGRIKFSCQLIKVWPCKQLS